MSADRRLAAAMMAYNVEERAPLVEAGLTWLGPNGPMYLAGDVRLRALAIDKDGVHWVDACLAVESAYMRHPAFDYYADLPGSTLTPAIEFWHVNFTRGRFSTTLGPIGEVCEVLDLDVPLPFPADNWARTYASDPEQTDAELLFLKDRVPGVFA